MSLTLYPNADEDVLIELSDTKKFWIDKNQTGYKNIVAALMMAKATGQRVQIQSWRLIEWPYGTQIMPGIYNIDRISILND